MPGELPPYAPPLLGLGTLRSLACARLRPVGGVLAAAYLLYVTVFMYLSNLPTGSAFYLQIQQRFWPQPNMLTCAWFALGVQRAARALAPHSRAPLAVAALVLVGWHARRGFEVREPSRASRRPAPSPRAVAPRRRPAPIARGPVQPRGNTHASQGLQPDGAKAATRRLHAAVPVHAGGRPVA